jgi:hypothetical protein
MLFSASKIKQVGDNKSEVYPWIELSIADTIRSMMPFQNILSTFIAKAMTGDDSQEESDDDSEESYDEQETKADNLPYPTTELAHVPDPVEEQPDNPVSSSNDTGFFANPNDTKVLPLGDDLHPELQTPTEELPVPTEAKELQIPKEETLFSDAEE